MSYEGHMLEKLNMPAKHEVEDAVLKILFKHNGMIKEFASGEEIVEEIADEFNLNSEQRFAYLTTLYRKEDRIKKSNLWHRLLFRAADSLAKDKLVSRPSETNSIIGKKEWLLTEGGYDKALRLLKIPLRQKDFLTVKSVEVERVVKRINQKARPEDYNPLDVNKNIVKSNKEFTIRERGFRQAIIEAYDHSCAFCGMKIQSPDNLCWEVEAAHIVPHSVKGKDDIWNGIALCHLHHWAFDVGWFTIGGDFKIILSEKAQFFSLGFGRICQQNFLESYNKNSKILLPKTENLYPHKTALFWHRENRFHR
jgi:hypothetical protein